MYFIKNKLISFHYYNPRDFVKPTKAQKDKDKKALTEDLPMQPTKATLEYDEKNPAPKVLK